MTAAGESPTSLGELARLFARLGATSFGGPAAHVAMMEDEVVRRRGWLTPERFLDLVSATNLIPGPNSTELAIHIGLARRGFPGLVVAGGAFIAPAMLMTAALAQGYVRYGTLPSARWLLDGVRPVMLAVVAQAIAGLAPKALPSWRLRAVGSLAFVATAAGAHELAALLGAGVIAMATARGEAGGSLQLTPLAPVVGGVGAAAVSPASLFGVFLKIGSVLFGSGYVLLAFLRAELVNRLHWMTEAQLLDAVAAGQVTPGPVFTTATFIGYALAGPAGALAATLGIFLPAFVFVALSAPLVPRMRASPRAAAFLDGVNAASLALMALVSLQLARAAVTDVASGLVAVASAVALLRYRVNATWLVLGGAALGALRWRLSG